MKLTSLLSLLIIFIVVIVIAGGFVVIIRWPVPPEPPCAACVTNFKLLGIAEIVFGLAALGVISRIRNQANLLQR